MTTKATADAEGVLLPGISGTVRIVVTLENTAVQIGSGSVEVLASPEMIRLMEMAAVAVIEPYLPAGVTTVGTHLDVSHLAATPVGMEVTAYAELIAVEGRRLTFRVEANDAEGLIGQGSHQRMLIDLARFNAKMETKRAG